MSATFRAKAIVLAIVLTVFGIGGTVSTATAAYTSVVVRNTSSSAVPVKGTVSIGNRPYVYALQSGTWKTELSKPATVSIDPARNGVTIQNSPTVKLDPDANTVKVANSAANPLYVVEGTPRTPALFQLGGVPKINELTSWEIEVPAGDEWLVIKTIGWMPASGASQSLDVLKGGTRVARYCPSLTSAGGSGIDACEIPVSPGSVVRFNVTSSSDITFWVSVSGYMTSTP